jgi:hypothetical protein
MNVYSEYYEVLCKKKIAPTPPTPPTLAEKETSLVKKYTVSLECSDPLELSLLWSNMDSTELLQALLASGMSLYLPILEL